MTSLNETLLSDQLQHLEGNRTTTWLVTESDQEYLADEHPASGRSSATAVSRASQYSESSYAPSSFSTTLVNIQEESHPIDIQITGVENEEPERQVTPTRRRSSGKMRRSTELSDRTVKISRLPPGVRELYEGEGWDDQDDVSEFSDITNTPSFVVSSIIKPSGPPSYYSALDHSSDGSQAQRSGYATGRRGVSWKKKRGTFSSSEKEGTVSSSEDPRVGRLVSGEAPCLVFLKDGDLVSVNGYLVSVKDGNLVELEEGSVVSLKDGNLASVRDGNIVSLEDGNLVPLEDVNLLFLEDGNLASVNGNLVSVKDGNLVSLEESNLVSLKDGNLASVYGNLVSVKDGNLVSLEEESMEAPCLVFLKDGNLASVNGNLVSVKDDNLVSLQVDNLVSLKDGTLVSVNSNLVSMKDNNFAPIEDENVVSLKDGSLVSRRGSKFVSCEDGNLVPLEAVTKKLVSLDDGNLASANGNLVLVKDGNLVSLEESNLVSLKDGNLASLNGKLVSVRDGNFVSLEDGNLVSLKDGNLVSLKGNLVSVKDGILVSLEEGSVVSLKDGTLVSVKDGNIVSLEDGNLVSLEDGNLIFLEDGNFASVNGNLVSVKDGNFVSLKDDNVLPRKNDNFLSVKDLVSLEDITLEPTEDDPTNVKVSKNADKEASERPSRRDIAIKSKMATSSKRVSSRESRASPAARESRAPRSQQDITLEPKDDPTNVKVSKSADKDARERSSERPSRRDIAIKSKKAPSSKSGSSGESKASTVSRLSTVSRASRESRASTFLSTSSRESRASTYLTTSSRESRASTASRASRESRLSTFLNASSRESRASTASRDSRMSRSASLNPLKAPPMADVEPRKLKSSILLKDKDKSLVKSLNKLEERKEQLEHKLEENTKGQLEYFQIAANDLESLIAGTFKPPGTNDRKKSMPKYRDFGGRVIDSNVKLRKMSQESQQTEHSLQFQDHDRIPEERESDLSAGEISPNLTLRKIAI